MKLVIREQPVLPEKAMETPPKVAKPLPAQAVETPLPQANLESADLSPAVSGDLPPVVSGDLLPGVSSDIKPENITPEPSAPVQEETSPPQV